MDQSEIDREMDSNELYEKPNLPVSSSFEDNDTVESELEDNDTVESISTDHRPKETYFGELIRNILGFVLFCFAIFCFIRFLDIKVETSHSEFSNFLSGCCGNYFNSTRCSIKDECFIKFFKWIRSLNVSVYSSWQLKNCCYWYTPYMDWRINALPFCDLKCLQSSIFKSN